MLTDAQIETLATAFLKEELGSYAGRLPRSSYLQLHGKVVEKMRAYLARNPPSARCDFCSSPDPIKDYECDDYVMRIVHLEDGREVNTQELDSIGVWAACHTCSDLIESDNEEGLIEHSAREFIRITPGTSWELALEAARPTIKGFWTHRRRSC